MTPVATVANDFLTPGTFRSILPVLDDLLNLIREQSTAADPLSPVEASVNVAIKVTNKF